MTNANNGALLQLDCPPSRSSRAARSAKCFDLGGPPVSSSRATAFPLSTASCPTAFRARASAARRFPISGSRRSESFSRTTCCSRPEIHCRRNCSPSPARLPRRQHDRVRRPNRSPSNASCAAIWRAAAGRNTRNRRPSAASNSRRSAGILRVARTDLHTRDESRDWPRREHFLRGSSASSWAPDIAGRARAASLRIYNFARDYARQRGIIIADTKFEFGIFDGTTHPD